MPTPVPEHDHQTDLSDMAAKDRRLLIFLLLHITNQQLVNDVISIDTSIKFLRFLHIPNIVILLSKIALNLTLFILIDHNSSNIINV